MCFKLLVNSLAVNFDEQDAYICHLVFVQSPALQSSIIRFSV